MPSSRKPSTDRQRPLRALLVRWCAPLLLLGTVTVYASTVGVEVTSNDTYSAGLGAWVIAGTGEPWLDDLPAEDYADGRAWTQVNEDNGHLVVSRAPGPVAAVVPAALVGRALTGAEQYSEVPQAMTAALLTALAVLLLFLALRTRLSLGPSLLGAAAFGFATPVWSVSANAMWTHPLTVLGILGMACFAARERWWLVGVFGGIAVVGRLHTALIVAVLGCGMALARRRPRIAVEVALPSLGGVALASLWTHWLYGRWSPTGGYQAATAQRLTTGFEGNGDSALVNQLGMWVSPGYGILVWTPVLLLLAPAVVRGWHRVPTWARLLPLGGLLYTLAQAQLNTFTGGDGFFGYRHGLEFLASVTPCVVLAVPGHLGPVSRRLLGPLLGLQLAAFALGATSEAWFIRYTDAWRDNSLVLALRYEPLYAALVGSFVLVGYLGGRVWHDRAVASAADTAEVAVT